MPSLPASVQPYKRTPEFDENTIPAGLLRSHSTASGVWARIRVLEGELIYRMLGPEPRELLLSPGTDGVAAPAAKHEVEAPGRVRFYVEFLR